MVFKLQNINAVNITGDIQVEVRKPFIIPCFAEPTLAMSCVLGYLILFVWLFT